VLSTTDSLQQHLTRAGRVAHWYDVQVTPGPNAIVADIEGLQATETRSLSELSALFESWRAGSPSIRIGRERVMLEGAPTLLHDAQTSTHLARLWAHDEVARLLDAASPARERAIELAAHYQLVTPVTGAVVLETQQQYDEAGLTPVPPGTVPTIPEPQEWALIGVALLMLWFLYRRRTAYAMSPA
jgi:hypothetical protein